MKKILTLVSFMILFACVSSCKFIGCKSAEAVEAVEAVADSTEVVAVDSTLVNVVDTIEVAE